MTPAAGNEAVERQMSEYELTFGFSTSPNYERAVRIASAVPGYRTKGGQRGVLHIVPVVPAQAEQLARLLAFVSNWRSFSLAVDGVDVGRRHVWALSRALSCYRDRRLGGLDELHCWGLPGRRGRVPCRLVEGRLPWRLEGDYADPAVLPRLLRALAREAVVEICPAFDAAAVQRAALEQLEPGSEQDERQAAAELLIELGLLLPGDRFQVQPGDEHRAAHDREFLSRLLRDVDLGGGE